MSEESRIIRIGTRGSDLALAQTKMVAEALKAQDAGLKIELLCIKTTGDLKQDSARAGMGDKYDWIFELEKAILESDVDCAVNSGKDVPAIIHPETALLPVLPRANPYDAFISRKAGADWQLESGYAKVSLVEQAQFRDLPTGARVGTSSLRRKAELLRLRPDLDIVEHRGNVPTRIRKLEEGGDLSGIVLAAAGLERLGLAQQIDYNFSPAELLPAVNQGILVVQYRKSRVELGALLHRLLYEDTHWAWLAERACVSLLEADCNSAVGIYAQVTGAELEIRCRILAQDGSSFVEETRLGARDNAEELGREAARGVLHKGGRELLRAP